MKASNSGYADVNLNIVVKQVPAGLDMLYLSTYLDLYGISTFEFIEDPLDSTGTSSAGHRNLELVDLYVGRKLGLI